jgi:hypothetical protein
LRAQLEAANSFKRVANNKLTPLICGSRHLAPGLKAARKKFRAVLTNQEKSVYTARLR